MRITLCYQPLFSGDGIVSKQEGKTLFERELVLEDGAQIKDVLPVVCAKALAPYDKAERRVVGSYIKEGPLMDGQCYSILSKNVRDTIAAMTA